MVDVGWVTLVVAVVLAVVAGAFLGMALSRRSGRGQRPQRDPFEASLGFNYLVSSQPDLALQAFSRVAESDPDAVDVLVVIGNLYREKGQTERAIHMHRGLLSRASLTKRERTLVQVCLALDFRKAGFVDRAAATLHEILESEPNHREALGHLEKLYEGMKDWRRAYDTAKLVQELEGSADERELAFLCNQMGEESIRDGDTRAAQKHFEEALGHDRRCVPASLNLGTVFLSQRNFKRSRAAFEEVLDRDPRRLTVVWRRLLGVYRSLGEPGRLEDLCRRRIDADAADWRARMVLGELQEGRGEHEAAAVSYMDAIRANPHAFSLHHRLLGILAQTRAAPERLREYLDLCEDAMTLIDRYVCVRCHYRASELLWRCPSCQNWDPFVEAQG